MSEEKSIYHKLKENLGGRPPKFDTPEDMADKAIEYFEDCKESGEKLTVTGLVFFLGFQNRSSMRDYKRKTEFTPIINKMLLIVENAYEKQLHAGNVAGSIFALKNMGWKDKSELEYKKPDSDLTPDEIEERIAILFKKAKK